MSKNEVIPMTDGERQALKNFCDMIIGRLETEKGRDIVLKTTAHLRNGLIDKFHMITEEAVKQMLVLHIATLPVFDALFGEMANYNPITMVLNMATEEILDIKETDSE